MVFYRVCVESGRYKENIINLDRYLEYAWILKLKLIIYPFNLIIIIKIIWKLRS